MRNSIVIVRESFQEFKYIHDFESNNYVYYANYVLSFSLFLSLSHTHTRAHIYTHNLSIYLSVYYFAISF